MFFSISHDAAAVEEDFLRARTVFKDDGEALVREVGESVAEGLSDPSYKFDCGVEGGFAIVYATPAGADVRPLTIKDLKMDNAVLTFTKFPLGINGRLRDLLDNRYWTIRTLPAFPELQGCELTYREARKDEVAKIEALRRAELALISGEFARAGRKLVTGENRFATLAGVEVIEDIGFNLQRRSLGLVPSLDSRLTGIDDKVADIAADAVRTSLP